MNGSEIYKRLAGGQKEPVSEVIGHSLICLIIICLPVIALVGSSHNILGIAVVTLFSAIVLFFYVKSAIRQIKNVQMQIDKRHRMIETMSEAEFEELDAQVERGECYFQTFYLLDEYMYVPDARSLIRYSDIKSFQTEIHTVRATRNRRRKVGAYLELTDGEGIIYRLQVKDWKEYLDADVHFESLLNDKIAQRAGRSQ